MSNDVSKMSNLFLLCAVLILFNLSCINVVFASNSKVGNLDAKCELAKQYLNGNGVEQNYSEAIRLYTQAAKSGSARAQNQLGIMYSEGMGVDQNCSEAVKWYNKAVKQNYVKAKENLAVRYYQGVCVDRDIPKALKLFKACAKAGNAHCIDSVSVIYQKELGDNQMAFKWALKAAEAGNPKSQMIVGSMYYQGEGVGKNRSLGIHWLKKAASQGNETAIDILRDGGINN